MAEGLAEQAWLSALAAATAELLQGLGGLPVAPLEPTGVEGAATMPEAGSAAPVPPVLGAGIGEGELLRMLVSWAEMQRVRCACQALAVSELTALVAFAQQARRSLQQLEISLLELELAVIMSPGLRG
mmetsp:Transcript_49756/g.140013  ORF Transcript_49756/g.140013 Transcript_49756/m.140013 type:complete len:128 (-) Transcript_49756:64-447(-)